jgi:succinyl-diaminopimelate desuccinylase
VKSFTTSGIVVRGLRQIDRESVSLIKLCRDLIRFPTENPPGFGTEIMMYIKDWLNDYGIRSRFYKKEKRKENLVSNLDRPTARSLIFYGHSDVVAAGDRRRWSFAPFSGKVVAGKVLGRGATDMKGGLAALLFAFKTVAQLDLNLSRNLQMVVVPDEENFDPNKKLLYKLIDDGEVSGMGCIMGEPTSPQGIAVGDKGDLWLRITAVGTPAHGSAPVMGDSAILRLNKALNDLARIQKEPAPVPSELRGVIPLSKDMVRQYAAAVGYRNRAKLAEGLITHTSVNVGTIRGGTMTNIVPESAQAEIALCLPSGETANHAYRRVKALVRHEGVKVKATFGMDSNWTSPNLPFIRALQSASHTIMNTSPKPFLSTGSSDAHAFRLRGIPTVWFGPGDISGAHSYDEYVRVKELVAFAKAYLLTAIQLCVS